MDTFALNIRQLSTRLARPLPTRDEKVSDPIKEVIELSLQASCTIFVRAGQDEWTGSGFHLGDGFIATAGHVAPPELLQGPHEITVTFNGRDIAQAELVVSEVGFDSAILTCPPISKSIPGVTLGDSDTLERGDIIAVIGSPEGFHDTATIGRVSNMHQGLGQFAPTPAWNDVIFVDAKILQGVSGGMVLSTDGKVYGSVMGVTGQNASVGVGENAICPSNKIAALFTKVRRGQ